MAELDLIPESLLVFFQEVGPEQLDLTRDAETIIERTQLALMQTEMLLPL